MPKKPKQKVLFIITKSAWGGAGRYVFDMATNLHKNDWQVLVASGPGGPLLTKCNKEGVPTATLNTLGRDVNPLSDLKSLWQIIALIKKEKPSILHLNSSKVGLLGALAGRLMGVPKIIFTAHGWASTEDRPALSRFFIHALHVLSVMLAHNSIVVSLATKKEIALPNFLAKKMIVIKNGIDIPSYYSRQTARNFLREKGVNDHGSVPWIGTIAELHKNKGLLYAISALSRPEMSKTPFVWVIIGQGELGPTIIEKIKELKLENKVFLVGFINEAFKYLTAFDIFLFPSIKEGLPYVLLEAGGAGLPIIASEIGGIPEIIEGGLTGFLVPPKKPEAIAQMLSGILNNSLPPRFNPQLIGKALAKKVREKFSLSRMLEETKQLYQS